MNIKQLRSRTGLSQKDFGSRLGLTSQSITKFEAGGNITDSIKKLIRYEFAEYLPEEERLSMAGNSEVTVENKEVSILRKENEALKQKLAMVKDQEDYITVLKENIILLREQVQHYKERLNITDDRSKTA
jgi:transcriptional regulator with XRE-family HTH domain